MHVLIAPDSFKEACSAPEAAAAIARGLQRADPSTTCDLAPVADGGEGTALVLARLPHATVHTASVPGPTGDPTSASWVTLDHGRTAVVELAAAAGLHLVPPRLRDPLHLSTAGVGHLLRHALDQQPEHLILALGGSATVDAGAGLLHALGAHLLDASGSLLPPTPHHLQHLASIDLSSLPALPRLTLAHDVDNPALGPDGAARVYGPQKGATPASLPALERAIRNVCDALHRATGLDVAETPGAGAAGAAALPFLALGALPRPGADFVLEALDLGRRLQLADLVLTGEGRLDAQTARGKAPRAVARLARLHGVPAWAFAGQLAPDLDLSALDLDGALPILDRLDPLVRTLVRTPSLLEHAAHRLALLLRLGQRLIPLPHEPRRRHP